MAPKRVRPPKGGERTEGGTAADDEHLIDGPSRLSKKQKTSKSSNDRDDEVNADPEEDLIYIEESQRMTLDSMLPKGNEPADYGTIESVKLENFMCHKALSMQFGPFMNFVVGQNGSGKSAVLTALTLCLGAKASTTNRGGNMKSFIKSGEHTSVIEVHLRNRGDGFKHDIYGDTIIVQRSFNRDGVNNYKTRSKSGKIISTSKKELSDIIDYMSLQVDNPMTILSQDLARQFLSNSTDEDKYKFFMKGVQLDDLYALYQSMKSQQGTITSVLNIKSEDIVLLKEDAESAGKKFKALRETQSLREKFQILLVKHAWAQVCEAENAFEAIQRELEVCQKSKMDLEKELKKATDTITSWDQTVADASAAADSSGEGSNPLRDQKKELEDKLGNSSSKLDKNQLEERTIDQQIRQVQAKIDKAERDLATENRRLADADDGKHSTLLEKRESLLVEKNRIEQAQVELEQSCEIQKRTFEEAQSDLQQVEESIQRREAEFLAAENTLAKLSTNSSNNLAAYGDNMPRLLRAIERHQWKKQMPIGPIGLHVKLRQNTWSSILERQLSRVLNGFIAFCIEDKDRLIQMIKEYKCENNTVYRSKNDSMRLLEPSDEHLTILRVLEIEHEDIKRTLVNTNNIEQTILIEDHAEARRVMEQRPINVKFCYALNKNRRGSGFSVRMGQGSGSIDPIIAWSGASRIATDIREQIQLAKDEVEAAKQELESEKLKHQQTLRTTRIAEKAIMGYKGQKQSLVTASQRIDDRIEDIGREIERMLPESNKLPELEMNLQVNNESLETYNGQLQDNANEKKRLLTYHTEMQDQLELLRAGIQEAEEQTRILQDAHLKALLGRDQAVLRNSNLIENVASHEERILAVQKDLKEKEHAMVEMINTAEQIGARVDLARGESMTRIEKELERLNGELEKATARIGAPSEEVAKDFAEKTEKYREARKEIVGLEKLRRGLEQAFEDRMERWQYFRKYISVQSRLQFHYLMSEREFDGRLVFDHKRGVLQLKVQPTQQASDTQRNAKTLSGGEKSFSQICLLLALWEAMGSPFRCLDEFDVFMDAVNRGVSMGLIIKAAKNSVGKQFILITPQDVSTKGIDETADVRIVRMPDPERNQTTLNFPGR